MIAIPQPSSEKYIPIIPHFTPKISFSMLSLLFFPEMNAF